MDHFLRKGGSQPLPVSPWPSQSGSSAPAWTWAVKFQITVTDIYRFCFAVLWYIITPFLCRTSSGACWASLARRTDLDASMCGSYAVTRSQSGSLCQGIDKYIEVCIVTWMDHSYSPSFPLCSSLFYAIVSPFHTRPLIWPSGTRTIHPSHHSIATVWSRFFSRSVTAVSLTVCSFFLFLHDPPSSSPSWHGTNSYCMAWYLIFIFRCWSNKYLDGDPLDLDVEIKNWGDPTCSSLCLYSVGNYIYKQLGSVLLTPTASSCTSFIQIPFPRIWKCEPSIRLLSQVNVWSYGIK